MVVSICVVVPFDIFSIKSGSSERVKSDLKALLDIGCNIEIFLPQKNIHNNNFMASTKLKIHSYKNIQSFELLPEKIRLLFDMYTQPINPFFRKKLKKNFQKYDVVFAHFLYGPLASIIITKKQVPIIYVSHGFEYGLIKQVTRSKTIHYIIRFVEKYICRNSDLVLCVSESDFDDISKEYCLDKNKLVVAPNTINGDFFVASPYEKDDLRKSLGIPLNSFVAIFHGRMDYRPNLEALDFLQKELVPYIERMNLDIIVLAVGARMPQSLLDFESSKFLAFSDVDDIRAYISLADAAIVPLSSGGGSRIKILECFASKVPVISTKKGAEGINYLHGEHLIISELSASSFVNSMLRVKNHDELREKLTNNSYRLFNERYSSESINKLMNLVLNRFLDESSKDQNKVM